MKKVLNYLRSMRFGILLLILIAVLSLPGTVVPQGVDRASVIVRYGETWGGIIDTLGFNRIFSMWYFVALFALLCLNLTLCSVVRFGKVGNRKEALLKKAENNGESTAFSEGALRGLGKKEVKPGTHLVNGAGFYGSFLTHLGLLLLFVSAALVFSLQSAQEVGVKIGQSATLPDGTEIVVKSFDMKNVSGETDYISNVTLTHPGQAAEDKVIRVNEPVRFGNYTVYQQSYTMNAAEVELWTEENDQPMPLELEGPAFLSLGGEDGVRIDAIYPDHMTAEDGQIVPMSTANGALKNPCYLAATIENGEEKMGVVLPGTVLTAGGVYVRFPSIYPVFNVKYLPRFVMPLMYASFLMLTFGLYLCFFAVPKVVTVRGNKMTVTTLK
ncbi:MAG: cytochrome c biogenesis protein ResB [Clostridia bacterium]|nr:cytochrome c biogenesis protein ResB [Clostridia bacterium]